MIFTWFCLVLPPIVVVLLQCLFIPCDLFFRIDSLKRHRLRGVGIPIIKLRRSGDRLRFIMGIPIPISGVFETNRGLEPISNHNKTQQSVKRMRDYWDILWFKNGSNRNVSNHNEKCNKMWTVYVYIYIYIYIYINILNIGYLEHHFHIRNVVPEASIEGRDQSLHPTNTVGCNYLTLPLMIPASGTTLPIYEDLPEAGISSKDK